MKGAHRQAKERAGGRWAIYWYAWRGGPQIAFHDGATRAEAEAKEDTPQAWAALARAWADARDACDGDGGGDYCSGHYGGEPVYQHVTCSECDGTGRINLCPPDEYLPGEPIPGFSADLDEEIPF